MSPEDILKQLDFEPNPLRRRLAFLAGGVSCFAAIYPVAEVWPNYATGTATPPWPAFVVALGVGGMACFREANRSTLEVPHQLLVPPSPDLE